MSEDAALRGRHVLVVEDEYMIAEELGACLREAGASVVGPVGTLEAAMSLAASHPVDVAVLDMNLAGVSVIPLAAALEARGVPFVFSTGYDASAIPIGFRDVPRCEKPISFRALKRALARLLTASPR